MIKCIFIICIVFAIQQCNCIIPTIDQNLLQQDITTTATYIGMVSTIFKKLDQASNIAEQIKHLKSLQDVQKAGASICKLCDKSEQIQLQNYLKQINDDLCSQFSWALKNISDINASVKSVRDIITMFSINPKQAALALQLASVNTQSALQNTMSQIQMLLAQKMQKELAEQKLEQNNVNQINTGYRNSGL